jgi:hypothetical protein
MPIQIRCTCQQILAVDEAYQGQVVGCPYCGTPLTVPVMQQAPQGYPPPPAGYAQQAPQGYPPPGMVPQNPYPTSPAVPSANNPFGSAPSPAESNPFAAAQAPKFPGPSPAGNAPSMPFLAMDVPGKRNASLNELSSDAPNVPGDWDEPGMEDPRFWHIPCPNGHVLETPEDMLDQDVLCPYCETQFTLRKFQSVEETERRERERAIRDEKAGQIWLKWAIGIAAVVILGVIVMIAISASQ